MPESDLWKAIFNNIPTAAAILLLARMGLAYLTSKDASQDKQNERFASSIEGLTTAVLRLTGNAKGGQS